MNIHAMPDDQIAHPAEVPFELPDGRKADLRIAELAKMNLLEYDQRRTEEAKTLGIRAPVLDKLVNTERAATVVDGIADPFEAVDPWKQPVDGAALLSEIQATILRFCVLPDHSAPLMAVWVLHAWAHDAADISPVLAFVSPEKRCGKTTALSVVGALVPKAMHNVNITTSVLFRVIQRHAPTVLIDEADTYLTDNDELRGILNGGHNRLNANVWRSVGDDHEPRSFKVWAPKCIAMIGKLPDTLEDRSLVVHLRRKQEGESVERFRADRVNDFKHLRQKAARWARDNVERLRKMDPYVPAELNDRAQDNARAICSIADAVGGDWPKTIRAALVGSAKQDDDEPQSNGVLLLRDIAAIFESRPADRIGSEELCEALCKLQESPWGEWRGGKPISTRGVAKLLKPYGVRPAQDRHGSFYRPHEFSDAFSRYLSKRGETSATSATSATVDLSATEKINEINAPGTCGACGTYPEPDASKYHGGSWQGEI